MISNQTSANENFRLQVLSRLNHLDESSIIALQSITEIAKDLFDTPIAAIGFIEKEKISIKASVGIAIKEISRSGSICNHTILQNKPMVITDASMDERFSDNPLVASEPGVRFYAGVPLHSPLGLNLGTLFVVDTIPRTIETNKINSLIFLAQCAITVLQQKISNKIDLKKLKKHEEQYRIIFEHAAIGIAKVSLSGHFLEINESLAQFLGYSRDELLNLKYQDVTYEEDEHVGDASLKLLISNQLKRTTFEKRYNKKDGAIVWANVSISLHRSDDDSPLFFISVIKDITERKKQEAAILKAKLAAEDAIERAHLAERRIISISEEVSKKIGLELHDDLGQHLTGISFALETLFKDVEESGYQLPTYARKISSLFDDAIIKTRYLAHDLYPVDIENSNLTELLIEISNQVNITNKISCKYQIQPNNIRDKFVILNIYRIVQEAINNAVKHSKASEVLINLVSDDNSWILSISDNGVGFKKQYSNKQKRNQGLGLLSMEYRSNLIGAVIEVLRNQNLGTTIKVSLKK